MKRSASEPGLSVDIWGALAVDQMVYLVLYYIAH